MYLSTNEFASAVVDPGLSDYEWWQGDPQPIFFPKTCITKID